MLVHWLVALAEDLREERRGVRGEVLARQRGPLLLKAVRRTIVSLLGEPACEHRLIVGRRRVVEPRLALLARNPRTEHLLERRPQPRLIEHGPGRRTRLLEDRPANRIRLLLFALELELVSLLLPVLERGALPLDRELAACRREPEERKERVLGVRFDEIDVADRAREGDVEC